MTEQEQQRLIAAAEEAVETLKAGSYPKAAARLRAAIPKREPSVADPVEKLAREMEGD